MEPRYDTMPDAALERLRLTLANAPCPDRMHKQRMRDLQRIAEVQEVRGEARRAAVVTRVAA